LGSCRIIGIYKVIREKVGLRIKKIKIIIKLLIVIGLKFRRKKKSLLDTVFFLIIIKYIAIIENKLDCRRRK
jgi:hypothetical protein